MRYIVKDYITVFPDGTFTFSMVNLPREIFYQLKIFVEKCLNETLEKNIKTKFLAKEEKVTQNNNAQNLPTKNLPKEKVFLKRKFTILDEEE